MAINKRKILQSAQKHLQKGALERALKDYKSVLEADPKDANVRLKIGDIYLRQGKAPDAIAAYLKVAQQFTTDGFDAKAVALYKQITKIDPKRHDIHVPLAELYQRLGLTSDAMAALQAAADSYHREGDKRSALDVLRKAATLDSTNTTSRLKVAEMLRQEGMLEEALAEYRECAAELERQGESEGRVSVLEKLVEAAPRDREALHALGRAYLAQQKWSRAEEIAQRMIEGDPRAAVEGCEVLAEAYRGLRRDDALPEVYRRMAEGLRARGNEEAAREILQRHVPSDGFALEATPEPKAAPTPARAPVIPLDDGVDDDELILQDFDDLGGDDVELSLDLGDSIAPAPAARAGAAAATVVQPAPPPRSAAAAATVVQPAPARPTGVAATVVQPAPPPRAASPARAPAAASAGKGDPEQLLAEASVYLRYGKRDRAASCLRSVLAADPRNPTLLVRIAESFTACDDSATAVALLGRAVSGAEAAGDLETAATARQRLLALDPSAAQAFPPLPAEPEADELPGFDDASAATEVTGIDEMDLEFGFADTPAPAPAAAEPVVSAADFEFDDATQIVEAPAAALVANAAAPAAGTADFDFDFGEEDATPVPDDALVDDARVDEAATQVAFDAAPDIAMPSDIDVDVGDLEVSFDPVEDARERAPVAPEPADEPEPAGAELEIEETVASVGRAALQRVAAELEEAAFYLQQGLYDEAEAVCQRILDTEPAQPLALAQLAEIQQARASEPAAPEAPPEPEFEPELELELAAEPEGADEPELAAEPEHEAVPEPEPAEEALVAEAPEDDDVSLAPESAPELEPVRARPTAKPAPRAAAAAVEPDDDTEPGETLEAGDFDLAKELSGAFHEGRGAAGGTAGEGFEEVFAAFKHGVERELGDQEHEARYDLGIAYREMGLLDDAVGEFRIALAGPSRKLDCLLMMGLCVLDLGRPADAIEHFLQALALPEVPEGQQVALRYELGAAFEAAGDVARARESFAAAAALDPEFRDVGERIASLASGKLRRAADDDYSPEEATDADDFESFEDLVEDADASADAEPQAAAPETAETDYESFDDLMDADDDDADAAPAEEPAVSAPPVAAVARARVPEPEPEPLRSAVLTAADDGEGAVEFELVDEEPDNNDFEDAAAAGVASAAELEPEPAPEPEPEPIAAREPEPEPEYEPEAEEPEEAADSDADSADEPDDEPEPAPKRKAPKAKPASKNKPEPKGKGKSKSGGGRKKISFV